MSKSSNLRSLQNPLRYLALVVLPKCTEGAECAEGLVCVCAGGAVVRGGCWGGVMMGGECS